MSAIQEGTRINREEGGKKRRRRRNWEGVSGFKGESIEHESVPCAAGNRIAFSFSLLLLLPASASITAC